MAIDDRSIARLGSDGVMISQSADTALNDAAYVVTVIVAVFFMISRLIYWDIAILSAVLGVLLARSRGSAKCPGIVGCLLLYIGLILIQMLVQPSAYFSLSVATKEVSRLAIYMLVVLIVANTPVQEATFLKLWDITFLAVTLIAVFQFLKLFRVNETLQRFYGESVDFLIATNYSTLESFRAGTVFVNSNTYAKFSLAMLSVFLSVQMQSRPSRTYLGFLLLVLGTSLVLAGSRTGLVVTLLMLVYRLASSVLGHRGRVNRRHLVGLVVANCLFVIAVVAGLNRPVHGLSQLRVFKVLPGFENSMAYKWDTFRNMVSGFTALNLLIGLGPFETDIEHLTAIDFDLGYLVCFYGIAGCLLYALILRDFLQYRPAARSEQVLLNRLLTMVLVTFGLTGGMMLNLRIFAVFITLLYARIVPETPVIPTGADRLRLQPTAGLSDKT